MRTDDFEIGDRVKIQCPGNVCDGMVGRVVGRDYYTVDVRVDQVTVEMEDFEDSRTGVVSLDPNHLELLP